MIPSLSLLFSSNQLATLTALGEKALFALFQFHSWEEKQAVEHDSFLLPFSLNQVIRRLKIGKATFYNKVLAPLRDAGLIDVLPAAESSQELRLLIRPLLESTENPSRSDEFPSPEDEPTPAPPAPISPPTEPVCTPVPTKEPIPPLIEATMEQDARLRERKSGIIEAYEQCRNHPAYSDESFIQKMKTCVNYAHNKKRFGAYLRKALLNEWSKPPKRSARRHNVPRSSSPSSVPSSQPSETPTRPPDLPPWVWRQQQSDESSSETPSERQDSLSAEQRAEADRLLRKLEALTC